VYCHRWFEWRDILLDLSVLRLRTLILPFRCYVKLYDSPPKAAAEEQEAAVASLPAAERKKMRQKLRKAEAKAKKVCGEL